MSNAISEIFIERSKLKNEVFSFVIISHQLYYSLKNPSMTEVKPVDNMVMLNVISEEAILECLKKRYETDKIYVSFYSFHFLDIYQQCVNFG